MWEKLLKKKLERLIYVPIDSLGREFKHFFALSFRVKENRESLM
jgi:hypothetical protein